MGEGGERAVAEQTAVALYLLGALGDEDRVAFERHLAGCDRCLAEAAEVGPVTSALGLLPEAAVRDLLAEADAADDVRAGGSANPDGGPGPKTRDARRPGGPASTRPPAVVRPPARQAPPGRRDTHRGRARQRQRMIAWTLAVVATIAVGAATVTMLRGRETGMARDGEPALVASAEASIHGASLSVMVTGTANGSTVRATVTGLRPGILYRLYAVTRDGESHTVRDWAGARGTQQVLGELSLPVDSLAFFTVAEANGDPVVTAPLVRDTGRPTG